MLGVLHRSRRSAALYFRVFFGGHSVMVAVLARMSLPFNHRVPMNRRRLPLTAYLLLTLWLGFGVVANMSSISIQNNLIVSSSLPPIAYMHQIGYCNGWPLTYINQVTVSMNNNGTTKSIVIDKDFRKLLLDVILVATVSGSMFRLMHYWKRFSLRPIFVLILLVAIWLTVDRWLWSVRLFEIRRLFHVTTYLSPIPLLVIVESTLCIKTRFKVALANRSTA